MLGDAARELELEQGEAELLGRPLHAASQLVAAEGLVEQRGDDALMLARAGIRGPRCAS